MFSKTFKIILNTILFLFIGIGVLVAFSFIPFPGNYKVFTVQSGSMEPAIKTGSVIFVKPSASYATGDIVTRRTLDPKVTVTHRIVEEAADDTGQAVFKTKGDANDAADAEFVSPESIIGKTVFSFPFLGYPVSYAKTQQGLIVLIVIPAVIIIYDEIHKISAEIRKKIKHKKDAQKRKEEDDPVSQFIDGLNRDK